MQPLALALAVSITVTASAIATPVQAAGKIVELDAPGALESIERDNPEHSRRIHAILATASKMPCQNDEFTRVIRTAFDARDGHCTLALMTSLPAKRVLRFTLDETSYRAVIQVDSGAKVMPATTDATIAPA